MKKSTTISDESQNVFDKTIDVNKINEEIVKEYQNALINKKILLNTSLSHYSSMKIQKTEYKKIVSSLFLVIIKTAQENSRIILEGYIEKNANYCIKIKSNKNKVKNINQLNENSEIEKILKNCRTFIYEQQGKLYIKFSPKNSLNITCYLPVK